MHCCRSLKLLLAALTIIAAPATSFAYGSGISGYSGKSGSTCSSCHSGGTTPTVTITGPTSLSPGQVGTYQLKVTGGPAKDAGLDVAAAGGTLANADSTTKVKNSEITHSAPKAFTSGSALFNFTWTAPASGGSYKLYGAGMSTNGSGTSGDGVAATTLTIAVTSAPPPVCTTGQTQSCYTGPAGTAGVGACRAGTQTCSNNAWGACTGQVTPAANEACDGIDNNCNGTVDEGCPTLCTNGQTRSCYDGATGTQGVGICKAGTQTCSGGTWLACTGEVLPASSETCGDSKDNNCNGQVDEGCTPPPACTNGATRSCYSGPSNTKAIGVCKAGTQTCSGGAWGTCIGEVLPASSETCGDGKDNNCNGQVDENCAPPPACSNGATRACYGGPSGTQGVGVCAAGTQACTNGAWGNCTGEVPPSAEACGDGLDNNCDGHVDEGCAPPPMCRDGETRPCYSGASGTQIIGACRVGTQTCAAGAWGACAGEIVPSAEVCGDGVDNDCNGEVDEYCGPAAACADGETRPCYDGAEGTAGVGVCNPGMQTCANGLWGVCDGQVVPASREVCGDALDNDCNGKVDEGCTTVQPPMACSSVSGTAVPAMALGALITLLRRRRRACKARA